VSFLRGLRVLRVKLRRSEACLQTAKCRSLDSLCSLGMTGTLRSLGMTVGSLRAKGSDTCGI
jgi:hypothetical protein